MSNSSQANTIFFPLPLELTKVFDAIAGKFGAHGTAAGAKND